MISLADYWMGRDATHAAELTPAIQAASADLVGRVNLLLQWAAADGVRPSSDRVTRTPVSSGWRPEAINDATANAAQGSRHLSGDAVDLRDTGTRDLARWCLANRDALEEIGLWMERPQWTPTWVHLQRLPPGSRRRYYVPSSKPPLCAALPGEDEAAA